jgi:hypothetical protein
MATWTEAQAAVAEPIARPRRKTSSRTRSRSSARSRGGLLWIAVSATLLAGIVFINVAVLRTNLALDSVNRDRADLQAQVASDQSELSHALSGPRITAGAAELGLKYVDPTNYRYVNVAPTR